MLLAEIARASSDVAETPARLAKIERIASSLRELRPEEAAVGVAYLSGELPHPAIGIGWASLCDLPPAVPAPTLELLEVDVALRRIGTTIGPGSQTARRRELADLFGRATESERR